MVPPADLDSLSHAELKNLVVALLEQVVELQRTNAAQRDEIARLKGGSGRPNIKPNANPSGMEKATEPKPDKTAMPKKWARESWWMQNFTAVAWLLLVWRDGRRIMEMSEFWDRSEVILDRINDVFAGEAIQDVLNASMATLVDCVLTYSENDKQYPHEFVEDLLMRIRTLCLREWIKEHTNQVK